MTTELVREIAGHVFALGAFGVGAYMAISGQTIPGWLIAVISAAAGMYFPGMASAARARFFPKKKGCC